MDAKRLPRKRNKTKASDALYVFTNMCKESIVNRVEQPLLRRVGNNENSEWSQTMENVIYLPMKRKELLEFEICIKCDDGSFPSFLDSPLHMTLHLKQYPFFGDYESI